MPSVTGRVCYHPCETACNRAEHDEPIGIRSVERFLGDYGLNLPEDPIKATPPAAERHHDRHRRLRPGRPGGRLSPAPPRLRQRDLRGAGQAGRDAPGRHPALAPARGDPRRRDRQAARPWAASRSARGTRAGQDITWDELRDYPAAFLALGQDVGKRLPVEGIQARGVGGGLEFLREAGLGRPVQGRPRGAGHRRRQHRLGRGPFRDPARRRRGHDRVAGEPKTSC